MLGRVGEGDMSDSKEGDLFFTHNSFSGSLNVCSEQDELLAIEQPGGAFDNTQLSLAEVTQGLFEHAKPYQNGAALCIKVEKIDEDGQKLSQIEASDKTSAKRGIGFVYDEEVLARNDERIPLNTMKTTSWNLKVWNEWVAERNSLPVNPDDQFCRAPSAEILCTICDYELSFWLSKFVYEVRKRGGEVYPPKTVYQICSGIQRYLRNNGVPGLEIFKSANFKLFQDAIDSEMKRLTREGVGTTIKQAEPILQEEEEIMWKKGLLGDKDPKTLLYTLVFLFGKFFGLRSGEEHRQLTFSQLKITEGTSTERTRLQYKSHGKKNHGRGLEDRNIVELQENVEKPERCVVRLYKLYVSRCPNDVKQDEMFYLTPKKECNFDSNLWYTKTPIGKNSLRYVVANLCKEAGIKGYKTNYSPRATTCSLGLSRGVPDKLIMGRTGQKGTSSLNTYQRVSVKRKELVSDILQRNKNSFSNEPESKKAKIERSTSQQSSPVFNLTNCTVVFKL